MNSQLFSTEILEVKVIENLYIRDNYFIARQYQGWVKNCEAATVNTKYSQGLS